MKHVREQAPDVQQRRPAMSAATAAVVDRAMAKDIGQRYPEAGSMVADLEDVLAVEASRSGQATGEATTVLRTLPGQAQRRLPWRLRHPVRVLAAAAVVVLIVVGVVILLAGHAHRGTGVAADLSPSSGLVPVQLAGTAAHDYNPFGTGPENRDLVPNLVDGDPNTSWSTEQYYEGTLQKPGGVGLGVYLDAAPRVAARAVEIQTQTPGFAVRVYAGDHIDLTLPYGSSVTLAARGWHGPIGASARVRSGERIRLSSGGAHRYYLIWMTTLPPGSQSATISEVTLFR
jgi:serine/threonine-protein kinase